MTRAARRHERLRLNAGLADRLVRHLDSGLCPRHPRAGVLAQYAPQRVVEHDAAGGMLRFDMSRRGGPLGGVRKRDRAARQPLQSEEHGGERCNQPGPRVRA